MALTSLILAAGVYTIHISVTVSHVKQAAVQSNKPDQNLDI